MEIRSKIVEKMSKCMYDDTKSTQINTPYGFLLQVKQYTGISTLFNNLYLYLTINVGMFLIIYHRCNVICSIKFLNEIPIIICWSILN